MTTRFKIPLSLATAFMDELRTAAHNLGYAVLPQREPQ